MAYLLWHYTLGIESVVHLLINIIWATVHVFAFPLHVRMFFQPWRRLDLSYKGSKSAEDFFGTLVVNTMMRLIGMLFRISVMLFGICILALEFILFMSFALIWFFLPLVILLLMFNGLRLILL